MAPPQKMEIKFDSDSMRAIKALTRAIEDKNRIDIEIARKQPMTVVQNIGETATEETLLKVRTTLLPYLGTEFRVTEALIDMQNAGILFRERK